MDNNTAANLTNNIITRRSLEQVPYRVWDRVVSAAVHLHHGSTTHNGQTGGFHQESDFAGARAFIAKFVTMANSKGLQGEAMAEVAMAIGADKFAWKRDSWAWRD